MRAGRFLYKTRLPGDVGISVIGRDLPPARVKRIDSFSECVIMAGFGLDLQDEVAVVLPGTQRGRWATASFFCDASRKRVTMPQELM
jgi:hypothetical protein